MIRIIDILTLIWIRSAKRARKELMILNPRGCYRSGDLHMSNHFAYLRLATRGTHGPDHPFLSEFRSVLVSALLMRDGLNGVRTTNRTKVSSKVVIGSEAVGKALTSIQALTSDSGGDCKVISAKSRGMAPAA